MTAPYTTFITPSLTTFPTNVSDPTYADWLNTFQPSEYYQMDTQTVLTIKLDNGNSANLPIPSGWALIAITCQGHASLEAVTSDGGGLVGYVEILGNATFPGYLVLSTADLTVLSLTSLADNTTLQVMVGQAVEDGT